MESKKSGAIGVLFRRVFMPPVEKLILGNILKKGTTSPGDVVKDLGMSQMPGMKKILELKKRGYLVHEDNSSLIRINPKLKKFVKGVIG
ncbi:MAG: helix-turn-helix domain-containing protein [Bacteroidales bacterium]|nr:helix-turn-helix domain-containing protein [Bacteroidales bacterium]